MGIVTYDVHAIFLGAVDSPKSPSLRTPVLDIYAQDHVYSGRNTEARALGRYLGEQMAKAGFSGAVELRAVEGKPRQITFGVNVLPQAVAELVLPEIAEGMRESLKEGLTEVTLSVAGE